jgi:hypothetical protein
MPKGAQVGQYVHIYPNIFCDDSKQDAWHDYNCHAVAQQVVTELFPHLKGEYDVSDQGSHFFGTETLLNQRELPALTGVVIKVMNYDEAGEGTGTVDMKCSQCKKHMKSNAKFDLGDSIDAHSKCVSCDANGGVSGNANVVMDSASMAKRGPKPQTLDGITRYHTIAYNADKSITVHKSYRVGRGKTIPAADLDKLMVDRIPPAPASYFQPNNDEGALQHRAQVKGTFEEEARGRKRAKAEVQVKKAEFKHKAAAKQQEMEVALQGLRRSVVCDGCNGTFTPQRLETHKRVHCARRIPDGHLMPCPWCKCAGHKTPANKKCTEEGRRQWRAESEDERQLKAQNAVLEYKRTYEPRFVLNIDMQIDEIQEVRQQKQAMSHAVCGEGGVDKVEAVLVKNGDCGLMLEDTDAGVVVVRMEKGGVAYRSLLVRKGLVVKQIVVGSVGYRIENAADCSSKLGAAADGVEITLLMAQPAVQGLMMGWAIKPPKLSYPPLSEQQEDFLMRQYHKPGKLPPAAVHRAMGEHFQGRNVLHVKRIKSWISRFTAMLKKKAFTASIRAAQARLQEELGDGVCADAVREVVGGEEEEEVVGVEEGGLGDGDSDEEEAEEPAPPPKHGYQYRLQAPLGTQSLVGMRLTYRFRSDEGWLDGIIRSKCTSSGVGMRQLYNVSFADCDDCTEMKLNLSEYGVNRRWALWEWKPPTDSGLLIGNVPLATAPEGWEIDADAPAVVDQAYLKALHRPISGRIERDSRRVMFRFDAPVDWHVSEVWEVKKRGKLPGVNHTCENGYVKLRFLSDGKEQWAELLQSEYGLQQSWLVLKPMATAIGTGGAAPTGIGGMKVAGLKEVLLQLGLNTKGLKAELVRRLAEARRGEEGAQDGPQ